MKKIAICAAIAAIFVCEGKNESALILRDSLSKVVARSEVLESELRRQEQESRDLVKRVNYQEITNQTIAENQLTVTVQDFLGDDEVGESYNRSYPIQKMFLEYTHDFENGVSHPLVELFAVVDDLEYSDVRGKIVTNPEFVNEDESLVHQFRINKNFGQNGYQMNDNEKKAIPFMEIFIGDEDWEDVIEGAKLREDKAVAYEKVDGSRRVEAVGEWFSKAGDDDFEYQKQDIYEDWKRPDGTIFVSKTENEKKREKQKLPEPQQTPQQHVVQQPQHSGGVSNEFERLGKAFERGDCIIM